MEIESYRDKKIAILGFGEEGRAAYSFFNDAGAVVSVYDEHPLDEHPKNTTVASAEEWDLDGYDLIIRSPGISPHRIKTTAKVSSVTQLFLEQCPAKIIGVTGTKGKGTTASLISKILTKAGIKNHLLGNIGKPALDVLEEIGSDDVVVYEMSSFQLWDTTLSPSLAVVLMVEPEHLDVHKDLDDYLEAKSNISKYQNQQDVVIMHPFNELSEKVGMNGKGTKKKYMAIDTARIDGGQLVVGGEEIMSVEGFGLIGPHNRENICAALTTTWELTQDKEAAKRAIGEFKGLEHRIEHVRDFDGVSYYNDSFATTPGATIAALNSFYGKGIVVILGGSDKHADYSDLAEAISMHGSINQVILIGEMADEIKKALKSFGYEKAVKIEGNMTEIVNKASEHANSGDVVLLSPACASFDMFSSYKERGRLFKKAALDL